MSEGGESGREAEQVERGRERPEREKGALMRTGQRHDEHYVQALMIPYLTAGEQ